MARSERTEALSAEPPGQEASVGWLAGRVALLALAFGLLSAPIGRVGKPASPAYGALEEQIEKGPVDYAILGNSRPHVGLWPKLLSETLASEGVTARGYNFAVDGTDSVHHASFALHGLLAEAKAPRVIVWAVDPLMFDGSRKANRLEQLVRSDVALLARAGAPTELVLDVALMQIFPPYRHRPLMLAKVEDKTEGMGARLAKVQRIAGLKADTRPNPRKYDHEPDGFEPFTVLADWEFRFYKRHAVHYAAEYEKLAVSEWHLQFARQFLARAKSQGVVVVVLEMPESPYYREHFASKKKHLTWREQMKRVAEAEGAIFWDDSARYGSDSDFGDPGHLPRSTAEAYTRELATKLAREPRVRAALEGAKNEGKR